MASRIRGRRSRGMTMVEATVAMALGSMTIVSLIGFTTMVGRIAKATTFQQRSLKQAKETMESLNRRLRPSVSPMDLLDANNDRWANAIEFTHWADPTVRRIELHPGSDGKFDTPWDNRLLYFPNTATAAEMEVMATNLAPIDSRGAFQYNGVAGALVISLRIGDPVGQPNIYRTGVGIQGAEINMAISPRN